MIRLKDVAQVCGVSVATVSKALNDHTDIAEDTKRRIRDVASSLGYSGGLSAGSYSPGVRSDKHAFPNRRKALGVMIMDAEELDARRAYYSAVLREFRETADRCGYDVVYFSMSGALSYEARFGITGISGLFLLCAGRDEEPLRDVRRSALPTVSVEYLMDGALCLIRDVSRGLPELMTYLSRMGHRHIALVHADIDAKTTQSSRLLLRAAAEQGMRIAEEMDRAVADAVPEAAREATAELLAARDRPTCILYSAYPLVNGGLQAIHAAGLRIPDDISIAGYGDFTVLSSHDHILTALRSDAERVGRIAAQRLVEWIERPESFICVPEFVPESLFAGSTTAPPTGEKCDEGERDDGPVGCGPDPRGFFPG